MENQVNTLQDNVSRYLLFTEEARNEARKNIETISRLHEIISNVSADARRRIKAISSAVGIETAVYIVEIMQTMRQEEQAIEAMEDLSGESKIIVEARQSTATAIYNTFSN